MSDWSSDPRAARWLSHVRHQVLPMIEQSAVTAVLAPRGEPDIKIAVELGLSILLGKPIIAVVSPGQVPPPGLARVAHEVVLFDPADSAGTARRVQEAIARWSGDTAASPETPSFGDAADQEDS